MRTAIEDAKAPGFALHARRVTAAVQATRPLVDDLRYLSGAGLQPRGGDGPLDGATVRAVVDEVDTCVGDLASATIFELSDRYRAFCEAVEALLAVADDVSDRGIARPPEARAGDGWAVFTSCPGPS